MTNISIILFIFFLGFILGFVFGYICKKDPRGKDGKFKKKKCYQKW